MKLPGRGVLAFMAGVALTAASVLPMSFAQFFLVPGILVAMGTGAGTMHEPGRAGAIVTLAIIYFASFAVWSGVAYGALALGGKQRAA